MHTAKNRVLALALGLIVTGCAASTGRVFTDFDPVQDFSAYETYSWAGDDPLIVMGDRPISPLVGRRIANAIKRTMGDKGFRFIDDADRADFVVSYTVGTRDRTQVRTEPSIAYYDNWSSWRWGRRYWGPSYYDQVTVKTYTEGGLAIDVFDTNRESPVWHGVGSKRLSRAELENTAGDVEVINSAVQTILADFPPQ